MAELEELKKQFEEMQRRFGEQSGMLEQARAEQRHFLLLKLLLNNKLLLKKHHLLCTSQEIVNFQSSVDVVLSLAS